MFQALHEGEQTEISKQKEQSVSTPLCPTISWSAHATVSDEPVGLKFIRSLASEAEQLQRARLVAQLVEPGHDRLLQ